MKNLRPDGYALVIPFLFVKDIDAALAFYEEVLGFARTNVNEPDGKIVHAELSYRDRIVAMVSPAGQNSEWCVSPASRDQGSSVEILVYVEDAAACHERAVKAGATSLGEPKDWPWGERIGHIMDPDGYRWLLDQNLNRPAAE